MQIDTPLKNKLLSFGAKHAPTIRHHANFLEAVEQQRAARAEAGQPTDVAEGYYGMLAKNLRNLQTFVETSARTGQIDTDTALSRHELQELFTKARGALQFILGEHQAHHHGVSRRSDPEKLAARYRKKHYLTDDEALEEGVLRRLRRTAKMNRLEARETEGQIGELRELFEDMQALQTAIFPNTPPARKVGGE